MNFYIITFGCKLNQAESEMISADLFSQGFCSTDDLPSADIIIINSCAVTLKAVRDVRQFINRAKRENAKARIFLTGCVAEDEIVKLVDFYISNKDKDNIVEYINSKLSRSNMLPKNKEDIILLGERQFTKIQSGCNNFCSYCIVPFTRGLPISLPPEKIISNIRNIERQGHKEVVLTGVNIGLYDYEGFSLLDLLKLILKKTTVERIRLGSLWPTHITDNFIDLYAHESRLCPHFHLSIQSGSNSVLEKMNRNYTREEVFTVIDKCRKKIKDINFTADIIVGFPGESDDDFQDSCNLIERVGFSKLHIFRYSVRPGTSAEKMKNKIGEQAKKERSQKLLQISDKSARNIKKKYLNKKLPVLWEGTSSGWVYGFTDNYLRVKKKLKESENLRGKIENHQVKYFG